MLSDGKFSDATTWLTFEEAAKYLKMGKSTIYKLASEGNIPVHRAGRVWRFDAEELDEWLKQSPDIEQLSQAGMFKASANENENGKETQAS